MDQIKIGKYIAEKRKALGLTQVELADKLGMSNKSVSKWERGVCLPDVSLYMELCSILGISINEFLAGEDIEPVNIEKKSEENIISVTRAGNKRSKKFKGMAVFFAVVALVLCIALIVSLVKGGAFMNNYVEAYDHQSYEYQASTMLIPGSQGSVFRYKVDEGYKTLAVHVYEYEEGKLVNNEQVLMMELGSPDPADKPSGKGIIGVINNYPKREISMIIAEDGFQVSSETSILKNMSDSEMNGMASVETEGRIKIPENGEIPVCGYYLSDGHISGISPDLAFSDPSNYLKDNKRSIIVTFVFE